MKIVISVQPDSMHNIFPHCSIRGKISGGKKVTEHWLNLLKLTGHVMHQQFNIQQRYVLPTLFLCVLYLSEKNSDWCYLHNKLVGFYNRVEKRLPRGRNWVFK